MNFREDDEIIPIKSLDDIYNEVPGLIEACVPKDYWLDGPKNLPKRLRGIYEIGEYGSLISEFGWRYYGQGIEGKLPDPIRFEAAHRIEELERENEALRNELDNEEQHANMIEADLVSVEDELASAQSEIEYLQDKIDEIEEGLA